MSVLQLWFIWMFYEIYGSLNSAYSGRFHQPVYVELLRVQISQKRKKTARAQFHQRSMYSFYARRSQKPKNDWQLDCLFYAFGIC